MRWMELTAGNMLRLKAESETVAKRDGAQQAVTASLQATSEYYEGLGDKEDTTDRAGKSDSSSEKSSSRRPERNCNSRE